MKLFVEGGGDSKSMRAECRKGFRQFLENAGIKGKMPKIIASGSRHSAYEDYCRAIANSGSALLLVDSEEPVIDKHQTGDASEWQPWHHLEGQQESSWSRPAHGSDMDCHLMVQCMESWIVADRKNLESYFGSALMANALPAPGRPVETVPKNELLQGLKVATAKCKKGQYNKGKHSFDLLGETNPDRVAEASPWAKRFMDRLR